MHKSIAAPALFVLLATAACKTTSSAVDGVKSAGSAVASGVGGVATSLVNVNLSNVLNNLALDLKVDKANIPINAQIPITIAANVCGVSINILSIGAGGGSSKGCTAQTSSPELAQAVQQQLAANGSVGGGAQTTTPVATSPSSTPQTPAQPADTGTNPPK
jgi:predicted small secreted protein